MSKYQLAKAVQKELEVLNRRIDQKILRGLSYAKEAGRHKMLLSQLKRFNQHSSIGFWGKSMSFISALMF